MGLLGSLLGRRGFGYRPDPTDDRDFKVGTLLGALAQAAPPPSASLRHRDVGPKDQGATSSCVGQAWSQALRLAYLRAGQDCPELSALDVYFKARAEDHEQGVDGGTYLRSGGAGVIKFGAAEESAWPMRDGAVNKQPAWAAFKSAYDRRGLRGYHRIGVGDVDSVRRAIAAGFPVVGGWQVTQAFLDWNGQGAIPAQRGRFVGGHAMPIVGYAADGTFELLNSWGSSWGVAGYAITDEGFIAMGTDLWAVQVT